MTIQLRHGGQDCLCCKLKQESGKPDPESSLCCVTLVKSLPLTGISKVSWLEQLSSYVSPGYSLLCFDE